MANTDDDNRIDQKHIGNFTDYQKKIDDVRADAEQMKQKALTDAETKRRKAEEEAERKRQAALADIERRRREAEAARQKSLEAAQKVRKENEKALREGKELSKKAVEYGTKYSKYYARRGMDILRDGYRMMWQEVWDSFHDNRERAEEKRATRAGSSPKGTIAAKTLSPEIEESPDLRSDKTEMESSPAVVYEEYSDTMTTEGVADDNVNQNDTDGRSGHQTGSAGNEIRQSFPDHSDKKIQQKVSALGNLEQQHQSFNTSEKGGKQKTAASKSAAKQKRKHSAALDSAKTKRHANTHHSHGNAVTHGGPENTIPLGNYFGLVAIVPAFLSVMAYEFVGWFLSYVIHYGTFEPLSGLGMIIPMTLMTEFFMYFLAKSLSRRLGIIQNAMHQVAGGNYSVRLDSEALQPFTEIADSFNTMAEELGSVETLRDDFINDFSHEFKTPIASINGFAKLLLEEDVDPEDRQEYLQIIADESGRLAELASNTLMMNKLDNYSSIPNQEDYSLDEQIRQNVVLLSPQWEKKQIQMEVDLAPLTYHGNPDLMSQVWINILNNAIKFTPEQGTIAVRLQVRDNKAYISISDTGQGMSEEDRKRIFQKYYQADSSHASKGMGLGLSIAHRIIELCGGEIQVDSIPDVGSTFTVELPLDQ